MAKVGKKYAEAAKLIEAGKFYEPVNTLINKFVVQ